MTAQEELEALDNLYVADSPYDTQKNIAERIKWLLDLDSREEVSNSSSGSEALFYEKPE